MSENSSNTILDFNFKKIPYYDRRLTIGDCYDLFKNGAIAIPIREGGKILGVVDRKSLLRELKNQNF